MNDQREVYIAVVTSGAYFICSVFVAFLPHLMVYFFSHLVVHFIFSHLVLHILFPQSCSAYFVFLWCFFSFVIIKCIYPLYDLSERLNCHIDVEHSKP